MKEIEVRTLYKEYSKPIIVDDEDYERFMELDTANKIIYLQQDKYYKLMPYYYATKVVKEYEENGITIRQVESVKKYFHTFLGKSKRGYVCIFKDGNRFNFQKDNLELKRKLDKDDITFLNLQNVDAIRDESWFYK